MRQWCWLVKDVAKCLVFDLILHSCHPLLPPNPLNQPDFDGKNSTENYFYLIINGLAGVAVPLLLFSLWQFYSLRVIDKRAWQRQ
jgi:hypothetical protein